MSDKSKVIFYTEDNEKIEFEIIEQTKVNGCNYLLVTEAGNDDEDETEAYIMKEVSVPEASEAVYDMVEDDNELEAVGKVFSELLEDFDIM